MTTTTQALARHTTEVLDLDLIDPHPRNPRRDLGDLTELTASIKADGVRNAIHVRVSDDGQRYVVVQGHRRRQASIDAGRTTIPALIREDLKTDADVLVEMAVENLLRTDLTPLEEALLFEQLTLAGVKPAAIAKRTGRKRATIDARLALMTLPEQARDAVHGAQLSLDDAAALIEFADDEDTVQRLTKVAGTSEFRWQLQSARNRRENAAKREASLANLAAAGVTVVDQPGDWWTRTLGRVLGDAVPGITDETTGEQDVETRRAWHAEHCEHHVAWVDHAGAVTYGCGTPAVHQPQDGEADEDTIRDRALAADVAGAAAADRQALLEREAKDREDCGIACAIRKEFVVELTTGARALDAKQSQAIAAAMAQHAVEFYLETDPVRVASMLGVALTDDEIDDIDEASKVVQAAMEKRTGVEALLAVLAAISEEELQRPSQWAAWTLLEQPRRWLRLLVDVLGYELTEWEAAKVAAADERAAEQAAKAAAEEAAGDIEDVVQDL